MPGPEAKLSFLLTNLTANTSYSAMIRSEHIYNQCTNLHKSAHIYTPYIFIYSLHISTHVQVPQLPRLEQAVASVHVLHLPQDR